MGSRQHARKIEGVFTEREFFALSCNELQQVFDEPQHGVALFVDDADPRTLGLIERATPEKLSKASDAVEWRPELVAQARQKFRALLGELRRAALRDP